MWDWPWQSLQFDVIVHVQWDGVASHAFKAHHVFLELAKILATMGFWDFIKYDNMHVPSFVIEIVHKTYSLSQRYVLVGNVLFCIHHLSCLVSSQCMLGSIVEVWT